MQPYTDSPIPGAGSYEAFCQIALTEFDNIKEGESALCESWRDEDNDSSVAITATSATGLIPTTDSWLCNEFPSFYCKGLEAVEEIDTEETEEKLEYVEEHANEKAPSHEQEISPMSSTETLVESTAAKIEATVSEANPKITTLESTLIPIWLAQQRADIKYRPEGFELKEHGAKMTSKKASKLRRVIEKVRWKQL